ncbi:MAG: aspartate aminotransferase family protein [Candidatus Riflebacteria bacterium]|nr:aspartate aminotransferase family protein [Candidatus Riflebacteria bacterium]
MTTEPRLFPFVKQYYKKPLLVDRAKGCRIYDESGNEYLDAYAGVASVSVGHVNSRVNARVIAQIGKVHHTTMIYRTRPMEEYLTALQTVLGDRLTRHFFVNSGSEAVDFACQTARARRNRPLIISFSEGFHGGTYLGKSATGLPAWQPAFGGDPNIHFHPIEPCRSCEEAKFDPRAKRFSPLSIDCSAHCLNDLETILHVRGGETAAVLIEPVLGVGGILTPSAGFFKRLTAICRTNEIDLICDEVQTGFGRCGGDLFAFRRIGFEPDILCMAKGIANGFPLGLVSATEDAVRGMADKLHFCTFGGNPVSCAAADETLKILLEERLAEHSAEIGERLMKNLSDTLFDVDAVLEIRGLGLMIGIEMADPALAANIHENAYGRGLLIGLGGRRRNTLRIEPPLVFTAADADQTVDLLVAAIREETSRA